MTIKEIISALECHVDCVDMQLSEGDAKEIIGKLKKYNKLLKVHAQWYEDLRVIDTISGRTRWKMKDLLDALRAR